MATPMTSAPDNRFRLLSPPTVILILAVLVAAASVTVSVSRTHKGAASRDDPAAKDWRVVGWAYAQNGDALASAAAYRRATVIEPDNAENWSSLGESLQTASATVVTEAEAALEKAIALDPSDPRARYFLAVQKDLQGNHKGAVADWLDLLRDTPAGAPWRGDLQRTIEQTATRYAIDIPPVASVGIADPAASAAIPGPTPEQLAAASSIPANQQDEMAHAMVERLAARLAINAQDADGWIRLMRSRMVLKDSAGAEAALHSSLKTFVGDAETQGRLRRAAAQLGVAGD